MLDYIDHNKSIGWIAPLLSAGPQTASEHHGNGDCKRQETEAPSSQVASASRVDLNFPLPGEKGPSCLLKVCFYLNTGLWSPFPLPAGFHYPVREASLLSNGGFLRPHCCSWLTCACRWQVYEDWDGFKLNDAVEVFGILSVSPALSALADEK